MTERSKTPVALRRRPKAALAIVACLGALLFAGIAAAQVTRSHPLPVKLDDQVVAGQMWVRFTETPIDLPFEDFAARSHDPAAAAFVSTIRALAAKDAEKARPHLIVRHTEAPLAELLEIIHQAFGRFEGLTIVNRIEVGPRTVFFMRFTGADGRPVTQGLWFKPTDGRWKGWIVEHDDPAEMLIKQALKYAALMPSTFRPIDRAPATHSIPAADGLRLEFAATVTDFDVYDDTQPPFSPVAALFRQAMLELLRSDWMAFATHFTPRSAEKIGAWVQSQPAEVLEIGPVLKQMSLRVLVEIPLEGGGAWLFYSQGVGPDHTDDVIHIARAAGDGRGVVRLTSYRKRDLVQDAITGLPGFPPRRAAFRGWLKAHRVGGTR